LSPRTGRFVQAHSAGGVVFRERAEGSDFLAIRPSGQKRWQLPKGTVEKGESVENAALREVREEGGVDAEIVAALTPITYFFRAGSARIHKRVDFFAMIYKDGDPAEHDHEIDEAKWFSASQETELTFESERSLVAEARGQLSRSID
jgi:8-oxo-dGTP pyrophosphatase MutT (NUDIX family)